MASAEIRCVVGEGLGDVFGVMFLLMSEMVCDEVVVAMESVVFEFRDKIAPFALDLCRQLSVELIGLLGDEREDREEGEGREEEVEVEEEDDGDEHRTLYECVMTLGTVLRSVRSSPLLFPPIFQLLLPLLKRFISLDCVDFFEETQRILSVFAMHTPLPLSQELFCFVPLSIAAFEDFAFDYFDDISTFIRSLLLREPQTFLSQSCQSVSFLSLTWKATQVALEQNGEWPTYRTAFSFLLSLLRCCRGHVDFFLSDLLSFLLSHLSGSFSLKIKSHCCALLCECLFYSPSLSLHILSESQTLSFALDSCFAVVNEKSLKSSKDWKSIAIGLSSLLSPPLSPSIASFVPPILHSILLVFSYMSVSSHTVKSVSAPRIVVIENEMANEEDDDVYKVIRCGESVVLS